MMTRPSRPESFVVRPLDRSVEGELDVVAERMKLTLVEVLGEAAGATMYSMDWLRDRVRWHLDPRQCVGEVLVAEADRRIVGHTIVRLDTAEGERIGLFSTTYVEPAWRRSGVADALLHRGEAWLTSGGVTVLVTDTSETNTKLISLFEKHGYRIVFTAPEKRMIRLSKTLQP